MAAGYPEPEQRPVAAATRNLDPKASGAPSGHSTRPQAFGKVASSNRRDRSKSELLPQALLTQLLQEGLDLGVKVLCEASFDNCKREGFLQLRRQFSGLEQASSR